jgi:F-type H+-transporting ATPase subunit a
MASFAPEVFFYIGKFPVTNTVINTILVDGFLVILAFVTRSKLKLIPGMFQNLMEYFFSGIHGFVENVAEKKTSAIFPVFMTFFLFIIVANLSGLVPGLGTFGIKEQTVVNGETVTEFIPFNRPTTSDLNTTLALAIVSIVITNGYAIHKLGLKEYLTKFFAFIPFLISIGQGKPNINVNWKNPLEVFISVLTPIVMIFVGLLELLSEFVKAVSLSFRLFGNIYAGDVVLNTVHDMFAFIFPIPFMMLELIAGSIQALVFAMLTMVFMIILSSSHHEDEAGLKEVSH